MSEKTSRKAFGRRADYRHFLPITTRWMDNDLYGHINNVVYYSFFDTAVNRYLIEAGFLDFDKSEVIGLVVETGCGYAKPVAFPDAVTAALRVAHTGTSSVRYEIALFKGEEDDAAAEGHFVHVYVDAPRAAPFRCRTLCAPRSPRFWR